MSAIDRLSSSPMLGVGGVGGSSVATQTAAAIGEIGHRVLAWVGASGGGTAGSGAWTQVAGPAGDFRPDHSELARGGDVYDLNGLAREAAADTGATPTQEGELRRALEDFTRAAVVQVAGFAGASGERQVAGIQAALGEALAGTSAPGADGMIERLGRATAALTAQNG